MRSSTPSCHVRVAPVRLLLLAVLATLVSACGGHTVASSGPWASENPPFDTFKSQPLDKLDLLFVIDNSSSMADKQALLAKAVPEIVDRLIHPIQRCSDSHGNTIPAPASGCAGTKYPIGPTLEFWPERDIHIGVITSSLGGHGPPDNLCNPNGPDKPNPEDNDHGHLLPAVRPGAKLSSFNNLGFLAFDGANGTQLTGDFTNYVEAAGGRGCGFESPLEAWYRFLVDPAPPLDVKLQGNYSAPDGIDQEVLKERADFLRPDSALAIVMLTDEDDCSIMDSGLGWLVARPDPMPHATSACASDPNNKCCTSCAVTNVPAGCPSPKNDPSCQKGAFTIKQDPPHLRCFQQKRRFGLDLLYPTERYVNALTQQQICPTHADGAQNPSLTCGKGDTPEANPIYSDLTQTGRIVRDPSLVFLAAITGVPWQDIATKHTLDDPKALVYKTASQMAADGTWDNILGDVNKYIPPKDPLMQESIDPRSGSNPVTGDHLVGPANAPAPTTAGSNPINGHERDIPARDDLQYACVFPLAAPRTNSPDCAQSGQPGASPDNPLCQNPATGQYGTTQYFAKAYPGLRQLQVLKDLGENAIVASICPKLTSGAATDPGFGYNPVVDALVERLTGGTSPGLDAVCLPKQLTPDPVTQQVSCTVVEALPPDSPDAYDCNKKPGRAPISDSVAAAVRHQLQVEGLCGGMDHPACPDFKLCGIRQLTVQTGLESCLSDAPAKAGVNGYCYVGGHQGSPALVDGCPSSRRQMLRFVPALDTPTPGATVLVSCGG